MDDDQEPLLSSNDTGTSLSSVDCPPPPSFSRPPFRSKNESENDFLGRGRVKDMGLSQERMSFLFSFLSRLPISPIVYIPQVFWTSPPV